MSKLIGRKVRVLNHVNSTAAIGSERMIYRGEIVTIVDVDSHMVEVRKSNGKTDRGFASFFKYLNNREVKV